MKKLHYPLWYRLNNRDRYLIWYNVEEANEDVDGVVLDSNGKLPVFISEGNLLRRVVAALTLTCSPSSTHSKVEIAA